MDFTSLFPLAVAAVFLAAVIVLFRRKKSFRFYTGPAPQSPETTTGRTVSLYGDSTSVLSTLAMKWPFIAFVNHAVAGTHLTDMIVEVPANQLKALPEQIAGDPSAVLINHYGLNDAIHQRDVNLFRSMLVQFVLATREAGKLPVFVSLVQFSNWNGVAGKDAQKQRLIFNNVLYEIASRFYVHYIDLDQVPFDAKIDSPDGLHPSNEYYERIDAFIVQYFADRRIFA